MREIIIYGVMGLAALVMIFITPVQVQEFEPEFGLTPRTFPLLILWGILILSVFGVAFSAFKTLREGEEEAKVKSQKFENEGDSEEGDMEEMNSKKLLGLLGIITILLLLIPYIGFYISVGIILFLSFYTAGRMVWKKNIVFTSVTMLTIWLVFEKVMLVYLPKGELFIS